MDMNERDVERAGNIFAAKAAAWRRQFAQRYGINTIWTAYYYAQYVDIHVALLGGDECEDRYYYRIQDANFNPDSVSEAISVLAEKIKDRMIADSRLLVPLTASENWTPLGIHPTSIPESKITLDTGEEVVVW